MNYLLDTCVVSDATSAQPSTRVERWLDAQAEERLYISAVTIGEIEHGIARLSAGAKSRALRKWLDRAIIDRFDRRIVPVDAHVARVWGGLRARCERQGRTLPDLDSIIAATALAHGLAVVTRNVADFLGAGVDVIDPWTLT